MRRWPVLRHGRAGHGGGENIWRIDSDGSNPKQLTHDRLAGSPTCTPDGKWVLYRNEVPPFAIERVPIEGGKQEVVSASIVPGAMADNYGISLSPDGKLLAFKITRSDTRKRQIALVSLDENGEAQRLGLWILILEFRIIPNSSRMEKRLSTPSMKMASRTFGSNP